MDNTPQKEKQADNQRFHEFLLKEYDNIASAHFKSNENITDFFRSFLVIISLPLTVVTALFNLNIVQTALQSALDSVKIPLLVLGLFFMIISLVGFSIYWYILNIHFDGIFYARTINGIRKYYFDRELSIDISLKNKYRVLPQSTSLPSYRDIQFFGPIIISFVLINTAYIFISLNLFGFYIGKIAYESGVLKYGPKDICYLISIISLYLFTHLLIYLVLGKHREFRYLKSNVIGVDIDGVLNKHREQFSKILLKNTDKILLPDDIIQIPVRDIPGTKVTVSDELDVFNDPEYWIDMPPDEDAGKILQKISNALSMKIYIFTLRPWPQGSLGKDHIQKWKDKSEEYATKVMGSKIRRFKKYVKYKCFKVFPLKILLINLISIKKFLSTLSRKYNLIEKITRSWLEEHDLYYDYLFIEKTSEFVTDPSALIFNRFDISRNIPIRFFVEDDIDKATKLSFVCDYVFLINHPYNCSQEVPENVIRVSNWNELYIMIKKLW